jgi:hypothetical protein
VQGPLDPDAPISFWGPSLTETLAELAFTAEGTAERIDGEIAPVRLELSWNGSGPDFISRHELGGRCTVFVSFDLTVDHCEIDGVTLATRLDHGTTLILTEGDWPRVSSRGYASATGLEGSLLEPPSGTEDAWFGLTLDGVPPAADDWAWHLRLDASEPTDGTWDSVQEQWPFVRGTLYPTD